jgi:superfamily II DNA or RNA helicase
LERVEEENKPGFLLEFTATPSEEQKNRSERLATCSYADGVREGILLKVEKRILSDDLDCENPEAIAKEIEHIFKNHKHPWGGRRIQDVKTLIFVKSIDIAAQVAHILVNYKEFDTVTDYHSHHLRSKQKRILLKFRYNNFSPEVELPLCYTPVNTIIAVATLQEGFDANVDTVMIFWSRKGDPCAENQYSINRLAQMVGRSVRPKKDDPARSMALAYIPSSLEEAFDEITNQEDFFPKAPTCDEEFSFDRTAYQPCQQIAHPKEEPAVKTEEESFDLNEWMLNLLG